MISLPSLSRARRGARATWPLAAIALLLALPAAASAAGTVSGGPERVKGGYAVSIVGVDAKRDSVTVMIDRGTAANGQSEIVTVTRGVRVAVSRKGASIKGSLGSRGSVALRLVVAGKDGGKRTRENCAGAGRTSLTGRLKGRLRLKLPNGKRVTLRSLKALATAGRNTLRCQQPTDPRRGDGGDGDGGDGQDDEPRLMLSKDDGGASLSFLATKRSLQLVRSVAPRRERGGAQVSTTAIARASGSGLLAVSGGGAGATVRSAGPFTGTGIFTSTMGGGPFAQGPLTGNLRVKLGGVPVISITGDDAVLLNGDKA